MRPDNWANQFASTPYPEPSKTVDRPALGNAGAPQELIGIVSVAVRRSERLGNGGIEALIERLKERTEGYVFNFEQDRKPAA